jgi:hypothetical protein
LGCDINSAYIFFGRDTYNPTYTTSQANIVSRGTSINQVLGFHTLLMDVNGDGKDDCVRFDGFINYANNSIKVYLNTNNTCNFASTADYEINNHPAKFSGTGSVNGNFNGDSYEDLLVPSAGNDPHGVYIFQGSRVGLIQTTVFSRSSTSEQLAREGSFYSGNINGDSYDDFCLGANNNGEVSTGQGKVFCWYGRENFESSYAESSADITLNGFSTNERFGRSVRLYDVNNDGLDDLLVGAYQTSNTAGERHGRMYIFLNENGTFSNTPWFSEVKTSGDDQYGALLHAWDWDNDGWANLMVRSGISYKSHFYELAHPTPVFTLPASLRTSQNIRGSVSQDSDFEVRSVEYSTQDSPSSEWKSCSPTDGVFDSSSEDFDCDLSDLSDGARTIYFRTKDPNNLYTSVQEYGQVHFTSDTRSPNQVKVGLLRTELKKPEARTLTTKERRMKVYFDAKDLTTSVEKIKVSEHKDFRKANWKDYDGDMWINFSKGDEKKRLYFKFKDSAGNESRVYEQLIKVDTTDPDLQVTKIGTFVPDFTKNKNYIYTAENPEISGTTEEKSMLILYVNGVEDQKISKLENTKCEKREGPDQCEFTLKPTKLTWGKHSVTLINRRCQAGNQSRREFNILIDTYVSH